MSNDEGTGSGETTTDHDTIYNWAEERGGRPVRVEGTGGEGEGGGTLRIAFEDHDEFEEIGWDEWFETFEESNLALVRQDETTEGETSAFHKLVSRE